MIKLIGDATDEMRAAADEVFRALSLEGECEVEIEYLGKEDMRALNMRTRKVDAPTDVLSFPALDEIGPFTYENYPFEFDDYEGCVTLGSRHSSAALRTCRWCTLLHTTLRRNGTNACCSGRSCAVPTAEAATAAAEAVTAAPPCGGGRGAKSRLWLRRMATSTAGSRRLPFASLPSHWTSAKKWHSSRRSSTVPIDGRAVSSHSLVGALVPSCLSHGPSIWTRSV